MPAQKTTTTSMISQRMITLKDSKPPMWRGIQVKEDTTLSTLHQIIQIAMGWTNSPLHQCMADGVYDGAPDPEYGFAMVNEQRSRRKEIVRHVNDTCLYE
jgi:Plasmid pRiA4b ORF-3-like protein